MRLTELGSLLFISGKFECNFLNLLKINSGLHLRDFKII